MYKTVIVRIKVVLGHEEIFRTLAQSLIEHTRQEPGNIVFTLYHSDESPSQFLFFAEFTSQEAYEQHRASEYLQRFTIALKTIVEDNPQVSVF